MITNTTDVFILNPVSENEVLKIISNFKDSSAGWDELKPLMSVSKLHWPIYVINRSAVVFFPLKLK